ncbi:class I adenylate-forming enzyme family protein [Micromonospora echinospora]
MSHDGIYAAVRDNTADLDRPALSDGRRRWSRRDLLSAAETLATVLGRQSDPLVSELADPFAIAAVTLAADLVGLPLVHRDPAVPAALPGRVIRDAFPAARADVDHAGEDIDVAGLRLWLRAGQGTPTVSGLPAGAQVFLTSGSTGTPSMVVRDTACVLADAERVAAVLAYAPDRPVVCAAPLFHAYGFNYALVAPLLYGSPVRLCPSRSLPSRLARAAHESTARILIALPAHYALMATDAPADTSRDAYAPLAEAVSAGAPLGPQVARTLSGRHAFALRNCYGSSEAGAVTLDPVHTSAQAGEIGLPLPGIAARLEPTDSGHTELLLRSDSMAVGRIGPAGIEPLTRDGWYHTGDLVERLATGRLRLRGRRGSVINVAGEKVLPADVEAVLARHPAVAGVRVLPTAHDTAGQVPVATVVVTESVSTVELTRWCRDRLAPHQVPRAIELVDALPTSATGKVLAPVTPEEDR